MKKERIFWGLFFIIGAALLLIGKLGLFGGMNIWTLIGTIFLVACLIKSVMYKSVSGILFSIAFICILYDKMLGIESLTPWPVLGAALLGSIGAAFLYHPKRTFYSHFVNSGHSEEISTDEKIDIHASFGEVIKYIHSENFERANIDCSFGSAKVFFDHALILKEEAVVHVSVSFGSTELFVPRAWKVDNRIKASFGGVDEHGRNESSGTPRLIINGEVSFGSVEITYI